MTTATRNRVPWYDAPPPAVVRHRPRRGRSAAHCVCGDLKAVHTRRVENLPAAMRVSNAPPATRLVTGCTCCACTIFEPNDGKGSTLGTVPAGCGNDYHGTYVAVINGGER